MSPPLLKGRALARQRVLGLVFLVVLALLAGLTVALYQKRFTPVDTVLLRADRAGNQLREGADVKVRGVLVGEVRGVRSTGDGATLELALRPELTRTLPRDVTARLLPKTLFGEVFVALSPPERPSGEPLRDGDVIGQDRSETAIETEQVLDDLLPLLQTLRPEQLSTTLDAVSGALRGRGERAGAGLQSLDAYLVRLNPELPGIQEGVRGLADLVATYDAAADDVLAVLDHLSALSRGLVDQREELAGFLAATGSSARELDEVLRENERRLVRLAADSLPSLQVYARYSPGFPCLAAGLVAAEPAVSASFGGRQPGLHITLEAVRDLDGYRPGDEPRYGDDGGPSCRGLPPGPQEVPFPFYRNGVDGYRDGQPVDPRTGVHGQPTAGPDEQLPARSSRGEELVLKAVAGAVLDRPADEVPDIAALLFGPLARGTAVGLD